MADLSKIIKDVDVNEVKELAKDVNLTDVLKVINTFDKKKAKEVLSDINFRAALKAAKNGDANELKKVFRDVDLNELKDLIDRDGDGDIKDDIEEIIAMIKD